MKPISKSQIHLTQLFRLVLYAVLVAGALWYVQFQARNLISGPRIALLNEPETEQTSRTVAIEGQAGNITSLELNGKTIFTDEQGYFEEILVLENGYTIMTLGAKDRFGRTIRVTKPFVYTQQQTIN